MGVGTTSLGKCQAWPLKIACFFHFGNITSMFQFVNNQFLTLLLGAVGCV